MPHIAPGARHIVHEVFARSPGRAHYGSGHVRQVNTQLLCGKTHPEGSARVGRCGTCSGAKVGLKNRCGLGRRTLLHHEFSRCSPDMGKARLSQPRSTGAWLRSRSAGCAWAPERSVPGRCSSLCWSWDAEAGRLPGRDTLAAS